MVVAIVVVSGDTLIPAVTIGAAALCICVDVVVTGVVAINVVTMALVLEVVVLALVLVVLSNKLVLVLAVEVYVEFIPENVVGNNDVEVTGNGEEDVE